MKSASSISETSTWNSQDKFLNSNQNDGLYMETDRKGNQGGKALWLMMDNQRKMNIRMEVVSLSLSDLISHLSI